MKKTFICLFISLFFALNFIFPQNAAAFVVRNGQQVSVSQGEVINETFLAAGQTVIIDGDIKGDVICAGQNVYINGPVEGDVICAGQNITVSNSVGGSIRVVGQTVTIGGKVGRNITVAGQALKIDSEISGEALFVAQTADINGRISKNIIGAASSITVAGVIGGNAQFQDRSLLIKNGASIAGALSYESNNNVVLESGSQVGGEVRKSTPPANNKSSFLNQKEKTYQQMIWGKIGELVFYLLIALLFVYFFKDSTRRVADLMLARPGRVLGAGLLILILAPIAAIIFFITIIGIPFGLATIALYIAAIFFSRIFAAIAVGRAFTKRYYKGKQDSLLAQTLIGVIGLWILFFIPVIGGLLSLIAVIWGLGGIYYLFRKDKVVKVV